MSNFYFNPNAYPFYPPGQFQMNPNAGTFYPADLPAEQCALPHVPAGPVQRRGRALGRAAQPRRRVGRLLGHGAEHRGAALPARQLAGGLPGPQHASGALAVGESLSRCRRPYGVFGR
ncbi:hypothetical protein PG985_002268 [Apiospora marii]|uniref:uncharacterized protein n=1 Tax=Apiospora marii TaxID=335849 RepID=UPI00312D21B0